MSDVLVLWYLYPHANRMSGVAQWVPFAHFAKSPPCFLDGLCSVTLFVRKQTSLCCCFQMPGHPSSTPFSLLSSRGNKWILKVRGKEGQNFLLFASSLRRHGLEVPSSSISCCGPCQGPFVFWLPPLTSWVFSSNCFHIHWFLFIFCVWCFSCIYVWAPCTYSSTETQKGPLNPLELELQVVLCVTVSLIPYRVCADTFSIHQWSWYMCIFHVFSVNHTPFYRWVNWGP